MQLPLEESRDDLGIFMSDRAHRRHQAHNSPSPKPDLGRLSFSPPRRRRGRRAVKGAIHHAHFHRCRPRNLNLNLHTTSISGRHPVLSQNAHRLFLRHFPRSDGDMALSPSARQRLGLLKQPLALRTCRGWSNFPGLVTSAAEVLGQTLVALARSGIDVTDVNLAGGGAAHVISPEGCPTYGDLDFVIELPPSADERSGRSAVVGAVCALLAENAEHQLRTAEAGLVQDAFMSKMFVTAPDADDAWALVSIDCGPASAASGAAPRSLDFKFVRRLERPNQFTVDAFSISLPARTLAAAVLQPRRGARPSWAALTARSAEDERLLAMLPPPPDPTDTVRTVCGLPLDTALQHLERKQIAVVGDESRLGGVRGGG